MKCSGCISSILCRFTLDVIFMLCGCICEFGEDLCLEYHMSFGFVLLPLKLWRGDSGGLLSSLY